ncbi:hypothetical protein RDI58_011744 [Solanum bulbocastanum]|uniref:Uncharacterized protein n=1 Tax=Solanum bulbocastanum TaxID=147425 RepID=A0AAN8TQE4_SOLBU
MLFIFGSCCCRALFRACNSCFTSEVSSRI